MGDAYVMEMDVSLVGFRRVVKCRVLARKVLKAPFFVEYLMLASHSPFLIEAESGERVPTTLFSFLILDLYRPLSLCKIGGSFIKNDRDRKSVV